MRSGESRYRLAACFWRGRDTAFAGPYARLVVVVAVISQTRQDRGSFLSDGVEFVRIEAQQSENGWSYLSCFHKAVDCLALIPGVGDEQHDVGVIPSVATVLRLFFQAPGVDHAVVWNHDDVRRTRIAAFPELTAGPWILRHTGRVEQGCERGAIENLAQSHCCSGSLQSIYGVPGTG